MPNDETSKRVFTLEEARKLLPEVKRMTQEANELVEKIVRRAEARTPEGEIDPEIQEEANRVITEWSEAIQKIGCEVKGLWLVDFDCGHGYYCWKFPEEALEHYHSYEEGFAGRMKIL